MGYRKKVVFQNLQNSFPDKNSSELKKIMKSFYINFSDYVIETLKSFTISKTELLVRVQHINRKVFWDAKKRARISLCSPDIFLIGNGSTL